VWLGRTRQALLGCLIMPRQIQAGIIRHPKYAEANSFRQEEFWQIPADAWVWLGTGESSKFEASSPSSFFLFFLSYLLCPEGAPKRLPQTRTRRCQAIDLVGEIRIKASDLKAASESL